jgi:hypothetical protein
VCKEPLAHHPPIKLNDLVFLPMHLLHFQSTTTTHAPLSAARRCSACDCLALRHAEDWDPWVVQRSAACCCCSRCPCLTVTHLIQSPDSPHPHTHPYPYPYTHTPLPAAPSLLLPSSFLQHRHSSSPDPDASPGIQTMRQGAAFLSPLSS